MRMSFYSIIALVGYNLFSKTNGYYRAISSIKTSVLYSKKRSISKKSISSDIYIPKTDGQREYYNALMAPIEIPLVVGIGPAGCGKTLFACQAAIQSLKLGSISKIVVTRPFVSVDQESMGFLPGSIEQKMSPWTRPIFDIFEEFFTKKEILELLEKSVIEMAPLAYMRGRTFRNTWIIADEMQNSSPNQMVMLLTRIGEGSRIVMTGDLQQSDLGKGNGLADFVIKKSLAEFGSDIQVIKLGSDDVQRSAFVRKILDIYSSDKKNVVSTMSSTVGSNVTLDIVSTMDLTTDSNMTLTDGSRLHSVLPSSKLPVYESSNITIINDSAMIPRHLYREKL